MEKYVYIPSIFLKKFNDVVIVSMLTSLKKLD